MINVLAEQIVVKLRKDLDAISDEELLPTERFTRTAAQIEQALSTIRTLVLENQPSDLAEEIVFYKKLTPQVYARKIHEKEICLLEINRPTGSTNQLIDYLEKKLKLIQRFFESNLFFYQYYKFDLDQMDSLYFQRKSEFPVIFFPDVPEYDPYLSTPLGSLFARFMAFENLREHIGQMMRSINRLPEQQQLKNPNERPNGLTWTGESINLVELAYGIWLTGQLNNGNATISEIIRWLEKSLNIKIGRAYRRWTEISRRDRDNTTKFLNRMRGAITARLENEDALNKQRRQQRRDNIH